MDIVLLFLLGMGAMTLSVYVALKGVEMDRSAKLRHPEPRVSGPRKRRWYHGW